MRMNPRVQGGLGEISAIEWLTHAGFDVFFPLTHSPDVDLVAVRGSEKLGVQVKTTTVLQRDRWLVTLATRGGNRSWSGMVKRFSAERCDALFVLTGDGRRWFIPAAVVEGGAGLTLGGPKYAEYEVSAGHPLHAVAEARSLSSPSLRRDSEAVKRSGL